MEDSTSILVERKYIYRYKKASHVTIATDQRSLKNAFSDSYLIQTVAVMDKKWL